VASRGGSPHRLAGLGQGAWASSLEDGERPSTGDLHPRASSMVRRRGQRSRGGEEARDANVSENALACRGRVAVARTRMGIGEMGIIRFGLVWYTYQTFLLSLA
jgi:hypothetical protein